MTPPLVYPGARATLVRASAAARLQARSPPCAALAKRMIGQAKACVQSAKKLEVWGERETTAAADS